MLIDWANTRERVQALKAEIEAALAKIAKGDDYFIGRDNKMRIVRPALANGEYPILKVSDREGNVRSIIVDFDIKISTRRSMMLPARSCSGQRQ